MDKLRVQVNGRGYYLKTDKPEEVLSFAKKFEDKILYITTKMPGISEAEATALSALLIMGDALKKERSDEDSELIQTLEERVEALSGELLTYSEAQAQLNSELNAVKESADMLARQLSQSQEREKELNGQCSDGREALSSANKTIARLNTERLAAAAANEALKKELESVHAQLEKAKSTIAEQEDRLSKAESGKPLSNAPVPEEIKKLKKEKEELEIDLAIANEEIEKLRAGGQGAGSDSKIAEYEKKLRQLEAKSAETDKLRSALVETEQTARQKFDEKENENDKLRRLLKNYESSYSLCMSKKEEEILALQNELEKLKEKLGAESEKLNGAYIQTTFES